jgi:hypothetical protein
MCVQTKSHCWIPPCAETARSGLDWGTEACLNWKRKKNRTVSCAYMFFICERDGAHNHAPSKHLQARQGYCWPLGAHGLTCPPRLKVESNRMAACVCIYIYICICIYIYIYIYTHMHQCACMHRVTGEEGLQTHVLVIFLIFVCIICFFMHATTFRALMSWTACSKVEWLLAYMCTRSCCQQRAFWFMYTRACMRILRRMDRCILLRASTWHTWDRSSRSLRYKLRIGTLTHGRVHMHLYAPDKAHTQTSLHLRGPVRTHGAQALSTSAKWGSSSE